MAVVTRWFGVTAAGDGDGSTWADRAALFSGGAWSSVITAFDFSGSDSLLCLIGPGTHAITATLQSSSFSVAAPTIANPIILHGCDSDGAILEPANPDWVSAQPCDWDDDLPVLSATTNIAIVNVGTAYNVVCRFLKFISSGTAANVGQYASIDWCVVENSYAGISSGAWFRPYRLTNSVLRCTGSIFYRVLQGAPVSFDNVRLEGESSATSGERTGFYCESYVVYASGCTIVDCPGSLITTGNSTSHIPMAIRSVFIGGLGISLSNASGQAYTCRLEGCVIVGSASYGVDSQGTAYTLISRCRFRDNTSGNFNGLGNYPDDLGNITSAGTDAAEFVDAASGDYRIKYGSSLWGLGIGAGDEPAPAGGGSGRRSRARVLA